MSLTKAKGVADWIDRRLPYKQLMDDHLLSYPTPRNLNYWWNFGSITGVTLVVMMLTGIVLAMHYTAHTDLAFGSVEAIMRDVNGGWLIRYIHTTGASMFFAVVYIHIFRGLYYGSYKSPRELLWIIGVLLLLLMMATAFMGYVLPWGQMSFWAATVITNLFSAIPLVGQHIVTWLWGGFAVDNPTLMRFYALHWLLPFIIVALVGLHLIALHTHGSNNPLGIEKKGPQDTIPFHPYYTIKDLFGLGVFALVYGYFVFFAPGALLAPENSIPANPLVTPNQIVPEWYFLPYYAILRSVPNKLGGVVLLFGSIAVLLMLPWLDGSKVCSATFRPVYKWVFWLLVIDCVLLAWIGSKEPEGAVVVIGRLATAYYFLHFLVVIPLLGRLERPAPLPYSIARPILGASQAATAPAASAKRSAQDSP